MQKKSIIQVLPALKQGGVERGTIEIAGALQQAGVRNYVISSGGKMVAELEKLGVEHITLPVRTKNPFKMWQNSYRLEKIFKEKNAGLVHVRSRAPAWSVKWACNRMGIPFIATFHGLYGVKPKILKKPYNNVMLQGRVVIAVSDFIQQHLRKEYQISEKHIRLIPEGADINQFDASKVSTKEVNAFAEEQGISRDKPIITLVGRLSRIKGHKVLLDAVQQMKNQNVTILFVGGNPKGDYETELNEKIKALSGKASVKMFSVAGDKMPLIYALSNVLVQPTLVPESFGRGIAEAQAMGRIVIASNHGGAVELIEDGQTGFLTPVGDSHALAEALDKVIEMPEKKRQEIEKAAALSVRTNFSIQKRCERTLDVYKEILGNEIMDDKSAISKNEANDITSEKLRQLEKIAHHIEKIRMGDYIELMARPRRIIWVNFLGGVSRGVGLTVGATLVIAILFKIISALIAMNIPYLTDMLQEVVQIVKDTPAGHSINVSGHNELPEKN